jgi:cobalt-zinc-cadmium efflux system membrane fusion protein
VIYRHISIRTNISILLIATLIAMAGCNNSSGATDEAGTHKEGGHEGHKEGEHKEGGHEGHGETPDKVEMTKQAMEDVGVEVSPVEAGSLRDNVKATAVVKHDINRVAHITPMVEGQVTDIRAKLGEEVEAGKTLAVMRSVVLGQARSAVNEAEAALEVARQNFERQKKLVDKGIASERSFIEARGALKQAEARYDAARSGLRALGVSGGSGPTYPLRSQIDGTIIEQHASVGETKGPQDELFVVADQSKVWVIGQVSEQDAHAVRPGMQALVTLAAYPNQQWKGTVDWIASTVDQKTRLLPIRVELPNPDDKLKPGMFGTVQLSSTDAARKVPLVPVDAVQQLKGQSPAITRVNFVHDRSNSAPSRAGSSRSSRGFRPTPTWLPREPSTSKQR